MLLLIARNCGICSKLAGASVHRRSDISRIFGDGNKFVAGQCENMWECMCQNGSKCVKMCQIVSACPVLCFIMSSFEFHFEAITQWRIRRVYNFPAIRFLCLSMQTAGKMWKTCSAQSVLALSVLCVLHAWHSAASTKAGLECHVYLSKQINRFITGVCCTTYVNKLNIN